MRVLKIIQANPLIFKADQHKNYTEIEAIRLVASMEFKGNEVQKLDFEIRQTYTAIYNLIGLGYLEDAVDLAIDLVPKAEMARQYKIAQDLCNTLITHFYQVDDLDTAHIYQSLYDKFTLNIFHEHESMVLFGNALHNQRKINPDNKDEIQVLLENIEKNLPFDHLWYHYYYYQFKSLLLEGEDREKLYHEAIDFFTGLFFDPIYFTQIFTEGLILYYLENNNFEQSEHYLNLLEAGSISWFRAHLSYAQELLHQKDLKSNDICTKTMNHPLFMELPLNLKREWRYVYKAAVKLLLDI